MLLKLLSNYFVYLKIDLLSLPNPLDPYYVHLLFLENKRLGANPLYLRKKDLVNEETTCEENPATSYGECGALLLYPS